jgi:hypothetical protein
MRTGGASADRAIRSAAARSADRALPERRDAAQSDRGELARCIGLLAPIDPTKLYDVA